MAKNRFPPFLRDATFSFRIAHGEKPVPTFSRDATFSFRIAHGEKPVPTFSRDALEHPHAVSGSGENLHRSEEHTSELHSLMRISYAVFCLKKKKQLHNTTHTR